MKLKRVRLQNATSSTIAVKSHDRWIPMDQVLSLAGESITEENNRLSTDMIAVLQAGQSMRDKWQALADDFDGELPKIENTPLLPFQPRSYRDFMLFEQHVINASRGYARRFLPMSYKIAAVYEHLFKLTFPKFRPHPLWYKKPIYYMGNHLNFVTDQHPVAFPSYSRALDYELELGVIIVKHLKNASEKEAMDAIGGFVVFNDFSARDVQLPEMRSGFGPVKAKHFINAISSAVVTADEIMPHLYNLTGEVRINDQTIVTTSTSDMDYTLGEAIAYASMDEQLYPGEFFGSGTLPGGCGMENGCWLAPDDTVELEIEKVGTLVNTITQSPNPDKPEKLKVI
ncbi:MAG: fumarylacetoacetate hydrolase family protein [Desulfobacteraceae bacterium]|nr:fumarylacetoacetate hydrolase family protein [Desulfobacteraceae bacterium]MBC2755103.1 fumarylacetoacetate hydrolase family protein [Desulfobacteraceae bacterium]